MRREAFRGARGAALPFWQGLGASGPVHTACPGRVRAGYDYHPLSRTAFGDALPPKGKGRVAVISAGTADGFVAWEAARTLAYLGIGHKLFEDCGVAGLWRLAERLEEITKNFLVNVKN